jgi:hypothetical protein
MARGPRPIARTTSAPDDQPLGRLLLRGVREAESMILVAILVVLDGIGLFTSLHLYPHWWVGVGWWVVLLAVAAADIAIGARQKFWGRAAWPVGLFVLAVSFMASAALPVDALLTPAQWSFGVVGWFGMLLFTEHRMRHVVAFIVVHIASTAVLLALHGVLLAELVTLATVSVGVGSFQFALILAVLVLRGVAENATAVAVAQAAAATRESVAREVHADRDARYAMLRESALPLLRGLADGTFAPWRPAVQHRAAVEAARMRRLFSEHGDKATLLAAEVESLVDLVERRGVAVRYAARPLVVEPPPEVRRSLVEAISGVLLVTARTARVTVGGTGSDVTVSVVTDGDVAVADGDPAGAHAHSPVQTSTIVDGGRTWVEARWLVP